MSKEPKSPKGEKASEASWYRWQCRQYLPQDAPKFKELYDKLVSLEAKIEELENVKYYFDPPKDIESEIDSWLANYQSEYAQLLKEHNL